MIIRPSLHVLAEGAHGVRIRVRSRGFADLDVLLQRGEIDLAVAPEQLSRKAALPRETLLTDRFVAVVWRGNPDVSEPLTVEDLQHLPYLGYEIRATPSMVDGLLREHGFVRQPEALVESFVVGANMIRGTRSVTFLQERLAQLFPEANDLRVLEPPLRLPTLTETVSWHPRASHDPAHSWRRGRLLDITGRL